jgi:HTH-type transcriptional regulator / antitoxin HigA
MLDCMSDRALFDLRPQHPGKMLRQMMEERGWSPDELASITGLSGSMIYSILSYKSNIGPDTALKLSGAFGIPAEEWLKADNLYRLSIAETNIAPIEKLARLYKLAPIREMQKREWIKATDDVTELESELKRFFGVDSFEDDLAFSVAAYRTVTLPFLNAAEKAWCFRARQMAKALPATSFSRDRMDSAEKKLRAMAAYPKEARHLANLLAEYGVRFVVIEPLPGVKIDGAAFWLTESSPVIALSVRFDRIDAFWFTFMHEWAHIRNGDALSVDIDLIDGIIGIAVLLVEDEAERRANDQAAASLIPSAELESFIRRVGPLYSKERIVQFAHKVKIHPGIIVGQLQYRNEIGFSANREMLAKVRSSVIETALTDGWNRVITPGLL